MMNPDESDVQDQQGWQTRLARGRRGLSASVEEALANSTLSDDDFDDESEMDAEEKALLIRPRLSLQSKPLPAVCILPQPKDQPVIHAPTVSPDTKGAQPIQKKRRFAGRTTRVELQAIPKQEKKPGRKTKPLAQRAESAQIVSIEHPHQVKEVVTEASAAVQFSHGHTPTREKLSGRGMILKGSSEAIVQNALVTPASVVLVTLLSNPGQVVVQYFTLLPGYGFTVHLSSVVSADTAFNYVVLLGELL